MRTQIVLESGKQGSGKDTIAYGCAQALTRIHSLANVDFKPSFTNFNVVCLKFADTIYTMHDKCLEILKERGVNRAIVKDGYLLQMLGTEWGRKTISENVWVDCLKGQVNNVIKKYEKKNCTNLVIFVTDCRFKNEFHAFPEALRVRLDCPEYVRKQRCSMWRNTTRHPSETDLDQYFLAGLFDLTLNTHLLGIEACVNKINAKLFLDLYNDSWIKYRGKEHAGK